MPRQLVAYMATFGTQFFSLKYYHCHLFTKFVMRKTNKWNEMKSSVNVRCPNHQFAFFHITKPLQSASSYQFCNAFNAKPTVEFGTGRSTLQVNTTHPTYHHSFGSLQSCQIRHFQSQSFTRISHDTLDAGSVTLEPVPWTLPRHNVLLLLMLILLLHLHHQSSLPNNRTCLRIPTYQANLCLFPSRSHLLETAVYQRTSYIGNQPHSVVYHNLPYTYESTECTLYYLNQRLSCKLHMATFQSFLLVQILLHIS